MIGLAGAGGRGRLRGLLPLVLGLLATLLLAGLLVACHGRPAPVVASPVSGSVSASAASPTSAPAPPRAAPQDEQVLAQYAAFWKAITPASRVPAVQRRAVLAPYATDPELGRLLRGLLAAEAVGEGQYGAEVPRARVASIHADLATVVDCQDASNAGKISLKTGKKLTRGVARNPVDATLRRGSDGHWRVATVAFTRGEC